MYLRHDTSSGAALSGRHLNLPPMIPLPQSPGLKIETWGTRFCGAVRCGPPALILQLAMGSGHSVGQRLEYLLVYKAIRP